MYVRNKILKGNSKQLPLQSRICVPDIGKPHPCRRVWEKKYVAHRRESRDLRHLRKNPAQNRNDSLTKHNIKGFHLFLRGKQDIYRSTHSLVATLVFCLFLSSTTPAQVHSQSRKLKLQFPTPLARCIRASTHGMASPKGHLLTWLSNHKPQCWAFASLI